jgi:hypothetical protein
LLQSCINAPSSPVYPEEWFAPVESSVSSCAIPVGLFSNQGISNDLEFSAPPLATILFDDKLAGFPVESIRISRSPDREQLIFRGVLAGVPLKQHSAIKVKNKDCETSWGGVTDTGEVGATLRTGAILYTGGALIPLSEKYKYSLQLLQDGALLIHLEINSKVLGALVMPLSFSKKYWLRYDRLDDKLDAQTGVENTALKK